MGGALIVGVAISVSALAPNIAGAINYVGYRHDPLTTRLAKASQVNCVVCRIRAGNRVAAYHSGYKYSPNLWWFTVTILTYGKRCLMLRTASTPPGLVMAGPSFYNYNYNYNCLDNSLYNGTRIRRRYVARAMN